MLTLSQFKTIFPANKEPEIWLTALCTILPEYGIDTYPGRLAMFLAQVGHESADFTDLTENLNYSADALVRTWPKRFTVATAADYAHHPEKIANKVYADRLGNGNEATGDGWRFRGYGPLQITGRGNRAAFAKAIGKSLDDSEAYLLTPLGGIESACWYWISNGLNQFADAGNIILCTRRINGGLIGLDDRRSRYTHIRTLLGA